ncbi:MAG TPA: DNA double-strand break repair nuclease NurA, partial [Chloroflexota bacterium]
IVDPRDPRRQVPMRDRHLDALRTVEELRALADLAEAEIRDASAARRDASAPPHDAFAAPRDAFASRRDAPAPPRDASSSRRDAFDPPRDAFARPRDASSSARDAFAAPRDAFIEPRDAFAAPRDASAGARDAARPPAVALVDGTLLFSVLEERPRDFLRNRFYTDFVAQLERLRQLRVPVAAYASRSRGIDLVHLFRALCGGLPLTCDVCVGAHACALRGLSDAHLLGRWLERWERSSLFRVRSNVHDPFYVGHRVYFFLLNTGDEIARVEFPEWVARDQSLLNLLHAVLVDQCTKGFGYPAVLARADDRAVIGLGDRDVLDTLVQQELARQGVIARPSAKLSRKQVRTV